MTPKSGNDGKNAKELLGNCRARTGCRQINFCPVFRLVQAECPRQDRLAQFVGKSVDMKIHLVDKKSVFDPCL
jgi:hypothetical protein